MPRLRTLSLVALLAACGSETKPPAAIADRDYLYVWTASDDSLAPDFLAVLDVTEDSTRYGRLVTTLPVPGRANVPHHTEHELPVDRQLFANGFATGQTFVFDLTTPAAPRIAAQFGDLGGFSHPHSFVRLPGGNVLATYQMTHATGGMRTGGLVELTPKGTLVRSTSADTPGADSTLRVYGAGVVPSVDRILTTTTDMHAGPEEASRTLQVWRLSDLSLLHQLSLPGPNGTLSAEPRLLEDGRTLLVSTFSCGLFIIDSLAGETPRATQVGAFPRKTGENCAIPVIVGHFYLVTVPAWSAVVSLDISNPRAPKEVSRVAFDSSDVPHWIAVSPDHRRVVVTGYATMEHTVHLLRLDPQTGQLALDTRFREDGATRPGFRMDGRSWPHGGSAAAVPHGAVFSRRDP